MYRHNVRVKRQRRLMWALLISIVLIISVLLLIVAFILYRQHSKPKRTTVTASVSSQVTLQPVKTIPIKEQWFEFELPEDWKAEKSEKRPYTYWRWKSTAKGKDDKTLVLYVDGPPANFAVNQLLPLAKNNDKF